MAEKALTKAQREAAARKAMDGIAQTIYKHLSLIHI